MAGVTPKTGAPEPPMLKLKRPDADRFELGAGKKAGGFVPFVSAEFCLRRLANDCDEGVVLVVAFVVDIADVVTGGTGAAVVVTGFVAAAGVGVAN